MTTAPAFTAMGANCLEMPLARGEQRDVDALE